MTDGGRWRSSLPDPHLASGHRRLSPSEGRESEENSASCSWLILPLDPSPAVAGLYLRVWRIHRPVALTWIKGRQARSFRRCYSLWAIKGTRRGPDHEVEDRPVTSRRRRACRSRLNTAYASVHHRPNRAENDEPNGWAGYVTGKEAPPGWGGESARQTEHMPGSIAVAQAEVCVTTEMIALCHPHRLAWRTRLVNQQNASEH